MLRNMTRLLEELGEDDLVNTGASREDESTFRDGN